MGNRSKMFFFVVLSCIFTAVLGLMVISILLKEDQDKSTVLPVSYSETPDNIVSLGKESESPFKYAAVTNQDTLSIFDVKGEKVFISIEHKNWKSIKWSPSGSLIGALGETANKIFNLFIYDMTRKDWLQATNYDGTGLHVSSYAWIDSDILLFVQDGWLHSYSYSSITEILKITKVEGDIYKISPNGKIVLTLLKDGTNPGKFYFYTLEGELLYTTGDIRAQDGQFTNVSQILFGENPETVILKADNLIYSHQLNSFEAIEIMASESFYPACLINSSEVLGYEMNGTMLSLSVLDIAGASRTQLLNSGNDRFVYVYDTFSSCTDNLGLLLKIGEKDQFSWWETSAGGTSIEEAEFLGDSKEVSINILN